jgi:cytochrome bd-type quinol oxidase subunit 1
MRYTSGNEVEMRLTPLIVATLVVAIASFIGQVMGAGDATSGLSAFAAAAFIGALIRTAWFANQPWWASGHNHDIGPQGKDCERAMAQTNALLLALGYAWGGLSLLSVYNLSVLKWQHGWQYGAGMLLIALAIWAMALTWRTRWSERTAATLQVVTLMHATAMTAALGWLVYSGKLITFKSDWAANVVFAGGGLLMVALNLISLRTARALESEHTHHE